MTMVTDNRVLKVPGPQPSKFLGRAANVFHFAKDSVGYTRQLFETYGSIVSLADGGGTNVYSPLPDCPGTVCVYGSEFVQQVATRHEIYYKYPLSGRMYRRRNSSKRTEPLKHFGVGLFGVNSNQHRQHRQLMMPAFHKQRIESYRDDIVDITQSVLKQLPVEVPCDIAEIMRLLTLRVATKTLFGEDIGSGGGTGRLLQDVLALLGTPKVVLLPFDLPGFPYHRLLNLMAQLDDEMRAIIQHKRSTNSAERDVLSMLIQARDEESGTVLNEDELLGHTGVLFAAGHETSSNALTWTLFLLSQHPQVAADLYDELAGKLKGEAPTVEQLQQLPLLERVIKESMRILPPVPWNGRVTSTTTELGGYTLPAGTEVFVSIYQTHHMPEVYSEPEVFNPDRWQKIAPTAFEYNPFSAGSRTCIGAAFAMMEIKIVLAMLLQQFRLQCIPQTKIDRTGLIVMAPKYGMPMIVHKQDGCFTQAVDSIRGNVREMVKLPS
ncbi:Unspecific monooxygenase [Gloeocapsa sp. PCC 7428]|nr:Unspecific monooxygenase [Gloeocapsa sp. PCC 7428]